MVHGQEISLQKYLLDLYFALRPSRNFRGISLFGWLVLGLFYKIKCQ